MKDKALIRVLAGITVLPHILLSNDDGIYSNGIRALAQEMHSRGWDVTVIAPRLQRSGEAKAITFDVPIRMQEIPLSYLDGKIGWRTTGTPADAVIHGVYQRSNGNLPPFDLVVSGINTGENTSVHSILTSGTCAVSFEAALLGIEAIAFSIDVDESLFFDDRAEPPGLQVAANNACEIILKVLEHGLPKGVAFLNVNFPDTITEKTPIEICRMAMSKYRDYTIEKQDPRGVPYYWIWGTMLELSENTDAYVVKTKKVTSITPITLYFDGRGIPDIYKSLNYLKKE
ncbi:MAG: 5'/3'-nucleotidase SurE [Candidatus Hodarchaeales archaeon]|jgi:5'-nucleotidase